MLTDHKGGDQACVQKQGVTIAAVKVLLRWRIWTVGQARAVFDVLRGGECPQLLLTHTEEAAQTEDCWISERTKVAANGWTGTHAAYF